ncbi:MAG: Trm112 family protein [Candidatus Dormibacteraeota bacterium]|nr:Trm112 family protein [Candidatus Dormibacteraeota bacterium]
MISQELLEVLACPKCKQKVELDEEARVLICQNCRLRYPIVDDIPVMLIEEAQSF